tara:strand:- start:601 stop:819 length:219 start_codon:yes stop_codon:yes gene_type:complete
MIREIMDTDKLKDRRCSMEIEIKDAVNASMASFRQDTGVSPHEIRITLSCVTRLDAKNTEYFVLNVESDIDI